MGFELTREGLVRAIGRATTPELINRGVPQGAIEPRNDGFVGRHLLRSGHHLRERLLQDVLGQRAVSDSAFQVLQESPLILQQRGDRTLVFAADGSRVVGAWETAGQVYFGDIDVKSARIPTPIGAPGDGGTRKHPRVAISANADVLFAWTEGAAWARGSSLAWQLFDHAGRAMGGFSRCDFGQGGAELTRAQPLDVSNHLDQRPIQQVESRHPRSFWNGFERPSASWRSCSGSL
jgi:hypothetical protein